MYCFMLVRLRVCGLLFCFASIRLKGFGYFATKFRDRLFLGGRICSSLTEALSDPSIEFSILFLTGFLTVPFNLLNMSNETPF